MTHLEAIIHMEFLNPRKVSTPNIHCKTVAKSCLRKHLGKKKKERKHLGVGSTFFFNGLNRGREAPTG